MSWLEPISFTGKYCTLEPLSFENHDNLVTAVQDGELWKLLYAAAPKPDEMQQEIKRRLVFQAKGTMLPFAVIHNESQKAIGMTSYCQVDNINKRLDIGFTWYARGCQRTGINSEAKLMLLTHAFEKLNCIAVGFRVDSLNRRSRNAVERLGAKFEGIVRNYSVLPNGNVRDMCFYSILPHEWPNVKTYLSM